MQPLVHQGMLRCQPQKLCLPQRTFETFETKDVSRSKFCATNDTVRGWKDIGVKAAEMSGERAVRERLETDGKGNEGKETSGERDGKRKTCQDDLRCGDAKRECPEKVMSGERDIRRKKCQENKMS